MPGSPGARPAVPSPGYPDTSRCPCALPQSPGDTRAGGRGCDRPLEPPRGVRGSHLPSARPWAAPKKHRHRRAAGSTLPSWRDKKIQHSIVGTFGGPRSGAGLCCRPGSSRDPSAFPGEQNPTVPSAFSAEQPQPEGAGNEQPGTSSQPRRALGGTCSFSQGNEDLHPTANLQSMASLCPTIDLWPTWTFSPAALATPAAPVVLGVLQGGPYPSLFPAPFAGSIPGFLSSHVQNEPVPRASQAVPWPCPEPAPCHWLGPWDGGEMWTFI